jgi:hypothetical protein
MTTLIHQNPLVLDYLTSRYFTGFQLKASAEQVTLSSSDGTIMSILSRAKFVKDEEEEQISIDVSPLVQKRVVIKKAVRDMRMQYEPEASDLEEALNTIHAFSDPHVKQRLDDGFAMYSDSPVLFPRGSEVIFQVAGGLVGGIVDSCSEHQSMFGNFFAITVMSMIPTSKGASLGKITHRLAYFDAKMPIDKLGIRPIRPEEKVALTDRGRKYNAFSQGATPANYHGLMTIPSWFRDRVMGADGRVMVDAANFAQIDADLYHEMMRNFQIDDDGSAAAPLTMRLVSEDDLWRCYNRVQGFSMRLKRWGWLDIDGLSPVIWRDDAFDQLVMEPKQKRSILHLVKHYGSSFSDFIDGKSGGLIFLLHGSAGVGKAQPLHCQIQTPTGPIQMGDVKVGDVVFAADGSTAKVLAVYPQGIRPCYELTFADGRKTQADVDHLWLAKTEDGRVNKAEGIIQDWDIVTTAKLRDRVHRLRKSRIPTTQPIRYDHTEALPLDPWFLGVMLGDGFFKYKHCSISSADDYILDRIKSLLPDGYCLKFLGGYDYGIKMGENYDHSKNIIRERFAALGLYGCGSHERFVPDIYMRANVEQRMELVRGLIDSDGYVGKNGNISYATTSETLAKNFQSLIWSLGGIAMISKKTSSYYDSQRGIQIDCRDCFNVQIRVRNPADFVSLPRKKERVGETNQYSEYFGLRIESIERIEDQPTQCILIDHPSHLYLTDDFLVTHNTLSAEAVAEALRRPLYAVSVGELGTTPDVMEEKLRSILDLAYQWNAVLLLDEADIFMEARDTHNVERNAMVSIFLRQLEYYSGVMFLTTNRVQTFDTAFFSRISLAINYPPLEATSRQNIWRNILTSAGVDISRIDLLALAEYSVNGRNIKTAVRIAQTMAAGNQRALTQEDLVEVLCLTETFNRLVKNH